MSTMPIPSEVVAEENAAREADLSSDFAHLGEKLARRGVDLDLMNVGDEVTLTIWPSRYIENSGFFVQAILADGSVFRDCGYREFSEAVASGSEFACEDANRDGRAGR